MTEEQGRAPSSIFSLAPEACFLSRGKGPPTTYVKTENGWEQIGSAPGSVDGFKRLQKTPIGNRHSRN